MNIRQKFEHAVLPLLISAAPVVVSAQAHGGHQDDYAKNKVRTFVSHMERHDDFENTAEYKYIPLSKKEYLKTAKEAVEILNKSPKKDEEFYQKLCQYYDSIKNGKIDLNDPMVRKTFLAYKKIVKRGADDEENLREGIYNEKSYLLGIDAKYFNQLTKTASPNMHLFCEKLYNGKDHFKMIDVKDAPEAEKIAERLLSEKLNAYNIAPNDTTFNYADFRSVAYTYDKDNEWNDWMMHVVINPKQLDGTDGHYCPLAVVKAHELGHIMQAMPGTKANTENDLVELAPTIELVVMQDMIYKEINNIPLEEEVTYPQSSPNDVNLGKIANTFRKIKEKYGCRSYEEVLLTPEANRAVNMFMTQGVANTSHSLER